MTQDLVNGLFELLGGILLWLNVRRILRDKTVTGVSVLPSLFFSLWGFWNLYYYPFLGQMLSFAGGLVLALANTTWVVLVFYFRGRDAQC